MNTKEVSPAPSSLGLSEDSGSPDPTLTTSLILKVERLSGSSLGAGSTFKGPKKTQVNQLSKSGVLY